MFFYISTNGQMTLNAFKAWLMTDEAVQHLEGLMPSWVLEGWMRADDSLKRRERICKKCISIAKDDERVKRCIVFRGDAGDAGCPGYSNLRIEEPQYQVRVEGTEFGRLVHDLPQVDVCQDDDPGFNPDKSEERRIVRELFRGFVEKIRMFREQEPSADYSSAMLYLESLSCSFPKTKKDERWFVISCLSNDGPNNDDKQRNFLPCAYKTEKKAREALKHLAEHVVPRNWERYKIVVDDRVATIAQLVRPIQGGNAERQREIKLQVEREPILVPKDRLIPIGNPLVRNWVVARTKNWETRDYTMEEWLRKLNPMNCEGSSGAEKAAASERYADKCDWWKFVFARVEPWDWVFVLRHRPDLIDKCQFVNDFSDSEWCLLLRRQPQFADRFDRWDTLPSYLWSFLLRRQPQFAARFNAWGELSGDDWVRLLKDQPQFSDRCDWCTLSGCDWKDLLIVRPEFASHCDWTKLSCSDWKELLIARPEYARSCDKWESISTDEWCELLEARPEFGNKCDWERFHWDEVSEELWVQLVDRQPQFLEKAGPSAAVWGKMSAANWVKVLGAYSDLQAVCEREFSQWEGLDVDVFIRLIALAPGLVARCNWPQQWTADEQVKILLARPEVVPHVCFKSFSNENWVTVLAKMPKLADKCDWNAFSEEELVAIVKKQTCLIGFVPRGRIVSRRSWIDLSKHDDACKQRFLQELNIDTLDGRAITDILLELPELAGQLPTERIVDEIDKKRLTLLQRELAEKTFGAAIVADCWSNNFQWKGRDGIVLGVCVEGDLFSLPQTIGPCDAIVVMTIRGRSKKVVESYENWKAQNTDLCKKVVFEEVPTHRALDDQWGYPPAHYYSIEDHDVLESLNRAFSRLSELGVRSVAINGINPHGGSFKKLVEDWFQQSSSSISVVYLVDKEDAYAFR